MLIRGNACGGATRIPVIWKNPDAMSGFIPDQSDEKATAGVALAARRKPSDDHAGCVHGVNVILYGQYVLNTEDIRQRQP